MAIDFIVISTVVFFFGLILNFVFKALSLKRGFLVVKDMSCAGGISIATSFFLGVVLGFYYFNKINALWIDLLMLAVAVFLFGVLDDLKNFSVRVKFFFQLLVSIFLIGIGIRTRIMYLNDFANIILTIIWILWVLNAFNLLDVMDGLAAGAAIIVSLGFLAVSMEHGSILLFLLCIGLTASLLSFFFYNFPPAKIYMGNSGSHFLGFVFAVVSLMISYASKERVVALATPVVILGFPIFDTVFLVFMRLWRKKIPYQKSGDHICLRYLSLGYSKKKTLFLLLGLCIFYAVSGISLSRVGNPQGALILVFVLLVSLGIAKKVFHVEVHD